MLQLGSWRNPAQAIISSLVWLPNLHGAWIAAGSQRAGGSAGGQGCSVQNQAAHGLIQHVY